MSSWKKAAKLNQKTHRERHQPEERKSLGLLEKKKDYVARAKDIHDKQATLKLLKKRVLNKNPDEFYHHMINSKIENGEHHELEKDDTHTPDQIQLMQTQDLKYITMKRTVEANKIKRLQSQLHLIDAANATKNNHTFFLDSEKEAREFDLAKRLDTDPRLLDRRTNRPRLSMLGTIRLPEVDEKTIEYLDQQRDNSYRELRKRVEREKQLTIIQQKMEIKRALQVKCSQRPRRVLPGTEHSPAIYEWKFERKK